MAISFAKKFKDRCPIFSPCFGVIPGHTWGKNGTHPVIAPTVLLAYLLVVHAVKYLPMISHLGNMSQMPDTDFLTFIFISFIV